MALAKTAAQVTRGRNLVMAGGVALNCVANSRMVEAGIFDNIGSSPRREMRAEPWGATLAAWHIGEGQSQNDKLAG
jgi:carbamoyltransferase